MTYQDYWYGDPTMTTAYRKANNNNIKRTNEELWLQGWYIYNAVSVSLNNAFSGKRGNQQKYIEKPIDILPKTEDEINAERKKEIEKAIKALSAWESSWKERHNKGE